VKKKSLADMEILGGDMENGSRKVQLIKVTEAYHLFRRMIVYYGVSQLIDLADREQLKDLNDLFRFLGNPEVHNWTNIGSQLVPEKLSEQLLDGIRKGRINSWDEIHNFYHECSERYLNDKVRHAVAAMLQVSELQIDQLNAQVLRKLCTDAIATREFIFEGIYESRAKDYKNPFRRMVYGSVQEMDCVVGSLADNTFIKQQKKELHTFKAKALALAKLPASRARAAKKSAARPAHS